MFFFNGALRFLYFFVNIFYFIIYLKLLEFRICCNSLSSITYLFVGVTPHNAPYGPVRTVDFWPRNYFGFENLGSLFLCVSPPLFISKIKIFLILRDYFVWPGMINCVWNSCWRQKLKKKQQKNNNKKKPQPKNKPKIPRQIAFTKNAVLVLPFSGSSAIGALILDAVFLPHRIKCSHY